VPVERFAARCCQRIITVSEANRQLAIRQRVAPQNHFVTVHNGVADCAPRALHGPTDIPRIVMVARFSEQKAQSLLVEAVSAIRMPFKLSFVGDGPLRPTVEQQVDADIPEILASANVFALFTNWEGFPISILEAMRAGLPVVASSVDGVPEAVDTGRTGYLAPAADVAAFRSALEKLLADPDLRASMGAAGRRRFENEFTVDAMLERTLNVYRAVAEHGPEVLTPGEIRHGTLTTRY